MKYWLYSCMIMCVVDFIKNCRLMKYRKHVNEEIEMMRSTINIFLPIYRLLMLISNLSIIFKPKEYLELLAIMEDIEMSSEEE